MFAEIFFGVVKYVSILLLGRSLWTAVYFVSGSCNLICAFDRKMLDPNGPQSSPRCFARIGVLCGSRFLGPLLPARGSRWLRGQGGACPQLCGARGVRVPGSAGPSVCPSRGDALQFIPVPYRKHGLDLTAELSREVPRVPVFIVGVG